MATPGLFTGKIFDSLMIWPENNVFPTPFLNARKATFFSGSFGFSIDKFPAPI